MHDVWITPPIRCHHACPLVNEPGGFAGETEAKVQIKGVGVGVELNAIELKEAVPRNAQAVCELPEVEAEVSLARLGAMSSVTISNCPFHPQRLRGTVWKDNDL